MSRTIAVDDCKISLEIVSRKDARERGMKLYFTGKPCKRGHIDRRRVSGACCQKCERILGKLKREKNKDKITAYQKKYRKDNPEKVAARHKKYSDDHKEEMAAYQKLYYQANKEKMDAQQEKYREVNRERIAAYGKQYRKDNPEKVAALMKRHYENHKEEKAAYAKQYNAGHKEERNAHGRLYYKANKEKEAARGRRYRAAHPEKGTEKAAWRKLVLLQRTPPWVNRDKIKKLYAESQRLTDATGIQHSVDHIIPLNGKLISGLHVETNLQILTLAENSAKSNKWNSVAAHS